MAGPALNVRKRPKGTRGVRKLKYEARTSTGAPAVLCYALLTTACFGSPTDYNYLYQAVLNGHIDTISAYLKNGGDVDILIARFAKDDQMGWVGPMIQLALQGRKDEIGVLLLRAGADTSIVIEKLGMSALQVAAQQGMTSTVALILGQNPKELLLVQDEEAPIAFASYQGNYDTVEVILVAAEKNEIDIQQSMASAMFGALNNRHPDIVRLLIRHGAKTDKDGILHSAVSSSSHSIVKLLLRHGFSPFRIVEGYSVMDILVLRLDRNPADPSAEIILDELIAAGVNPCEFSEKVEDLPYPIYRTIKRAAPGCDW